MEAYESIKTRHSVRAFRAKPITKEIMQKIVEVASNSPSYANTQPWETVVVSGEKKDKLSQALLKLAKANALASPDIPLPTSWPPEMERRRREHGARRLNTLGIERSDREGRERLRLMNFEFYGAPSAVFLFMDGSIGEWSLFDMGLFTQNLILAAHCLDIGSCIQASVTEYADEIKRFLNVAKNQKLVVCISMGYPDPDVKLNAYCSLKKETEEFLYWYY
ncbi:MAG: nitroreductase [Atribacterota bacterium]|nr:nitroreductase [Atribacterota bacterium]